MIIVLTLTSGILGKWLKDELSVYNEIRSMPIGLIDSRSLSQDASIRQAFELLSGTFGMVVTIVDEKEVLKGVVTDGDLRKALLNGQSIDTRLGEVANVDPVVVRLDGLENVVNVGFLRASLKSHGVDPGACGNMFAIPVVDHENKVKGLTTLEMLRRRSERIRGVNPH